MKKLYSFAALLLTVSLQAQVQRAIPRNAQLEAQRLKQSERQASASFHVAAGGGARPSASQWQLLTGSMNVYGMLQSGQHPLQYNKQLNAVSFIHRKSDFYNETPQLPVTARSGVIIAEVSANGGLTWDSTCIYASANNWGRYPQGALYNPTGNSSISNAQVIGCGVTVDNAGFSGCWYASKSLSAFTTTAGTLSAQQQYYTFNQGPYSTVMPRHGWMYQGFTITGDGLIHASGVQGQDLQGTAELTAFAVATGSFNGTTVDWKIDTLVPPAVKKSDSISLHINEPKMAWNAAGTIGYLVGTGVLRTGTLSNRSYQPIVYKIDKTVNANATWTLLPAIDFNATFSVVTNHLEQTYLTAPVNGQSVAALPYVAEYDVSVDQLNRLHLGAIFCSGYSDHVDSLQYFGTYTTSINPTEAYRWKHIPGHRPYLYDFIHVGASAWKLVLVDSLSSESPGFVSGDPGYQDNPWDEDANQKIPIDARLQMSRTENGNVILFSYAQSDSLFTNQQFKYNNLPDVYLRAMRIDNFCGEVVSNRVNATVNDNTIRTRATLHYMSPTLPDFSITINPFQPSTYSVTGKVPLTVTNSNPYSQLTNNATWFSNAAYNFQFYAIADDCTGIIEQKNSGKTFEVLPNPAQDRVFIRFSEQLDSEATITLVDLTGKIIKQNKISGADLHYEMDLEGLQMGMYFISIFDKSGQFASKKLVIE